MTDRDAAAAYLAAVFISAVAYLTLDLGARAQAVLYLTVEIVTIPVVVIGLRRNRCHDRRIWSAMLLGLGAWILAEFASLAEVLTGFSAPIVAELLYLVGQSAIAVATWRVVAARASAGDIGRLLDTALLSMGICVPLWLWVHPALTDPSSPLSDRLVVMLHAAVLLATVTLIVRIAVDGVLGRPRLQLFIGGVGILSASNIVYAVQAGQDRFVLGGPLDTGWLLFFGLVGAAALLPDGGDASAGSGDAQRGPSRMLLLSLWIMALVSPAILVAEVATGVPSEHTVLVAGLGTVVGFTLLTLRIWQLVQLMSREAQAESERADQQAEIAQQLRDVEQMKNTFLSAISHELRTPLTSIRGMSELLAGPHVTRLPPDRQREMITRVAANAERLERLLLDLLDFDRLLQGGVQPRRTRVEVTQVVRAVAAYHPSHPIHVPEGSVSAEVDPVMLERIVDNLLGNAAKHTRPGTPVWVELAALQDHGLRLVVSDAGDGIPARDRERILQAFARLDESDATPGTGIGLSLVAEFARMHGGGVTIEERTGGGTRFVVELPAAQPAGDQQVGASPEAPALTRPTGR